jgi:hypothetical protein
MPPANLKDPHPAAAQGLYNTGAEGDTLAKKPVDDDAIVDHVGGLIDVDKAVECSYQGDDQCRTDPGAQCAQYNDKRVTLCEQKHEQVFGLVSEVLSTNNSSCASVAAGDDSCSSETYPFAAQSLTHSINGMTVYTDVNTNARESILVSDQSLDVLHPDDLLKKHSTSKRLVASKTAVYAKVAP